MTIRRRGREFILGKEPTPSTHSIILDLCDEIELIEQNLFTKQNVNLLDFLIKIDIKRLSDYKYLFIEIQQ